MVYEYKILHNRKSFDQFKESRWFKYLIPYRTITGWVYSSYDYIDSQIQVTGLSCSEEDDSSNSSNIVDGQSVRDLKNESNMFWIRKVKATPVMDYGERQYIYHCQGPQGSGKEEFVLEHSLGSDERLSKKVLVQCDQLGKARSDNNLINTTASQLGYFPVFTWTNTVSRFVDLGVQGLTGQKSGLSESKDANQEHVSVGDPSHSENHNQ